MFFFCGIMFVGLKRVLWPANIKINHQRTELCNISIFGSIFLPVRTEVEWGMGMDFFVESCSLVRSESSRRRAPKLTNSELSCALAGSKSLMPTFQL
jgi:hypothetical protein